MLKLSSTTLAENSLENLRFSFPQKQNFYSLTDFSKLLKINKVQTEIFRAVPIFICLK